MRPLLPAGEISWHPLAAGEPAMANGPRRPCGFHAVTRLLPGLGRGRRGVPVPAQTAGPEASAAARSHLFESSCCISW